MLHWIKRGTRLFAGLTFFIVLMSSLVTAGSFSMAHIVAAVTYALIAAMLCWFAGFVISDIIIKGVVTHIDDQGNDALIDGGLLQQVKMMQEKFVPGGEELPFTIGTETQRTGGKTGRKNR